MSNVGIVIVSHSPLVAEGTADMVRQMVGDEVPLAWCGGNGHGGLGTNVAGSAEARHDRMECGCQPCAIGLLALAASHSQAELTHGFGRVGFSDHHPAWRHQVLQAPIERP